MAYRNSVKIDPEEPKAFRWDGSNWMPITQKPKIRSQMIPISTGCGCGAFRFVNNICVYCGGTDNENNLGML